MATIEQLFSEAIFLYSEKGSKFTMDELAERLCISKKTLYEMVRSKNELAVLMVDYYFEGVAKLQGVIHADESLSNVDKLRQLLCATPDFPIRRYHLREMEMNFPEAFQALDRHMRSGWERTLSIIEKAKTEGTIRDINGQLFSKLYAAAIEDLLSGYEVRNDQDFKQRQAEIVEILLFGICV